MGVRASSGLLCSPASVVAWISPGECGRKSGVRGPSTRRRKRRAERAIGDGEQDCLLGADGERTHGIQDRRRARASCWTRDVCTVAYARGVFRAHAGRSRRLSHTRWRTVESSQGQWQHRACSVQTKILTVVVPFRSRWRGGRTQHRSLVGAGTGRLSGSLSREQRAAPTHLSSNTARAKQSPCLLCAHRNLRRRVRARTSRSCCKKLLKEISVCGHESREAYRNSRVPTGRTGYLARLHSQIPAVLVPAAGARLLEG